MLALITPLTPGSWLIFIGLGFLGVRLTLWGWLKRWRRRLWIKIFKRMAVHITYFVHGSTLDNEKGISSGWSDPSLSKLGVAQSRRLKELIAQKKFDAVFCSDLKRAQETAHLVFEGSMPIQTDQRLRECNYGKYNGQPSTIVEQMQTNNIYQRFPEGESYEDVKKRVGEFLRFLRKNYAGKSVVVVSHKAPQLSLDVLIKSKTWEQAFADDWRHTASWQPGWDYVV